MQSIQAEYLRKYAEAEDGILTEQEAVDVREKIFQEIKASKDKGEKKALKENLAHMDQVIQDFSTKYKSEGKVAIAGSFAVRMCAEGNPRGIEVEICGNELTDNHLFLPTESDISLGAEDSPRGVQYVYYESLPTSGETLEPVVTLSPDFEEKYVCLLSQGLGWFCFTENNADAIKSLAVE